MADLHFHKSDPLHTPLKPPEIQLRLGGEARKILKLAIPISLESVFQMGFNAIDQIIVGLLGNEAALPADRDSVRKGQP